MGEAKSNWKVVVDILEGGQMVGRVLVHQDRTEAVTVGMVGAGAERMQSWLHSLVRLSLVFRFQRLSVKPVEGSILSENLVVGVGK